MNNQYGNVCEFVYMNSKTHSVLILNRYNNSIYTLVQIIECIYLIKSHIQTRTYLINLYNCLGHEPLGKSLFVLLLTWYGQENTDFKMTTCFASKDNLKGERMSGMSCPAVTWSSFFSQQI